jgi:LPS sulfotransferase NodH
MGGLTPAGQQGSSPGRADDEPVSCLIATTPWSGSGRFYGALRATGAVGDTREYFNPLRVMIRSREWGLSGAGGDFMPRYLRAVVSTATGPNRALSIGLPWSHQRWLVRVARSALSPAADEAPSDAEVIEAWYPRSRYVYLVSGDPVTQAVNWYAQQFGGRVPDLQEVRWRETLIRHQENAWEMFFMVHGITPYRVEFRQFRQHPDQTTAEILDWLGVTATARRGQNDELGLGPPQPRASQRADWLDGYLEARESLQEVIGLRTTVSTAGADEGSRRANGGS